MLKNLPKSTEALLNWNWAEIEPHYRDLQARPLSAASVDAWLKDWSNLLSCVDELFTRLYIATTQYTTDAEIERKFNAYIETIQPQARAADQALKEKLLGSQLEPKGFETVMRKLRADAALYRAENLPLLAEEQKLSGEYNKVIGAQTVQWEGEERTLGQMYPLLLEKERTTREKAWKLSWGRRLQDRETINELWEKFMPLRLKIAANAGFADYRAYVWQQKYRFDYTPEDCKAFHRAIEQVVVPAQKRVLERRRRLLGVDSIRPWDQAVSLYGDKPLRPYQTIDELKNRTKTVFAQVDPQFGQYFQTMIDEGLLDLEARKNKAPGAYSLGYAAIRRPFIFMSNTGTPNDVGTLLHEGGHAFHEFERAKIEYFQQRSENYLPAEFAEVASMGMELLGAAYLTKDKGGFYTEAEAARVRIENLEGIITFWPYMALVDAFQHWVYENSTESVNALKCEAQWAELWERFMGGIDYSGLEDAKRIVWHRQLHIHTLPFYYVEYGLAQLGAVQVWANSLKNQKAAVAAYLKALALGSTVSLPELFTAAGAKFAFDAAPLARAVDLIEKTITELETYI
jgi:oligoendopeptidase F